ncbi:MAG: hypothetical protein BGO33_13380 [Bacteroidia bacterium 43-41]|nr:MAG: hypothetical protein BGO33_13380 [Bacteroidia bacterium 43-41]
MKSRILLAILATGLFFLTACTGKSAQNTHTHEDGTVHEEHATDQAVPQQETFKVEADTAVIERDTTQHSHSHDGHTHSH